MRRIAAEKERLFVALCWSGESYEAIAAILGITKTSVKNLRARLVRCQHVGFPSRRKDLTATQKSLFKRLWFSHRPIDEIARRVGISPNPRSVYSHAQRMKLPRRFEVSYSHRTKTWTRRSVFWRPERFPIP